MLSDAVAGLAAKYGHRYFQEKTASGGKTDELWEELGAGGFLAVHLPEAYGGGGMGIAELAIVCEEVAAAGCPLLMMLVSPAICGTLLSRYGTEQQCASWLPPLASGEDKMAFAITEPDAGSNSHRISTLARRDGDEWLLSGTKYFISGMDEAGAVLVVARTGTDETSGRAELSLFVVTSDSPGLTVAPIPMEIRAPEKQFTLFFDEVAVGADRLVGGEGEGLRQVFEGLNPERLMSAATASGIGRYALESAARVREGAQRVGPADRQSSGGGSSLGEGEDRARARAASWHRRRRGATTTGSMPAKRRTWPSTRLRRPHWRPSIKPSRPMAATAWRATPASPTSGASPASCGRRR